MDIKDFNNTLLYSNKNIEKTMRGLINESTNAVLLETYDEKCLLADHTTGQIFEAKYSFDGNVFTFSDFKEISLEKNNDSLREAIGDYFDDANINLAEAYEKATASDTDCLEASLTEALASKNISKTIDYSQIANLDDESIKEARETEAFKAYTERLNEEPSDSVKLFNWKDAVKVAIIDEDKKKLISRSSKVKADKLRKTVDFKKKVLDASKKFVEESGDMSGFEDLISENNCILALDSSELKEAIGLSIVGDRNLMSKRNEISKAVENLISEDEEFSAKKEQMASEKKDGDDSDAPEASEQDTKAIVKALETAKSKATDEKLIDKIEKIISSLEDTSSEGETDVAAVKEAVELLSL